MTSSALHTNNFYRNLLMKKIILLTLLIPLLASCGGKKDNKEDAQKSYKTALQDSVKAIQLKIDSCTLRIQEVSDVIDSQITEFTFVENPREVEGYYILKNWQSKYPLQSTGIIARMSKSEQFEIIAALSGGTFDQIEVSSGENSSRSSVVPNDQALNYRREGITTVMFSGEQCNEVGRFIADNNLNNIKLTFLEKGKFKSSWQIPSDYKKMMTLTWVFASSNMELRSLELKNSMFHQKIDILRKHIE